MNLSREDEGRIGMRGESRGLRREDSCGSGVEVQSLRK